MNPRRGHLFWFVCLALAYVAVAVINREFSWAWGREWLAPTMMLAVLTATLVLGYRHWPTATRGCR